VLNPFALAAAMAAIAAAVAYAAAAGRLRGHRVPWPRRRTAAAVAGAATLVAGVLLPGLLGAGHDPRVHMTQHLLLGMVAPLLIALSAPVTLSLRTLRGPARRRLGRLLRARALRPLAHPVTALALNAGVLWALYLTPLHARALHDPRLGALVQVHLVIAGTLFAWAVAGRDPMPRRPSVRVRGAALVGGIALHTALTRLLVADADRLAAEAGGTQEQWRQAAELMWFEGDLVELALLIAFVTGVHGARRPRRSGAGPRAEGGPPEPAALAGGPVR
jgi:putative membrane protein